MQFFSEILKIVDGAVNADRAKVTAYSAKLADELEDHGQSKLAARIRDTLSKSKLARANLSESSSSAVSIPVDSESRAPIADESWPDPDRVVSYYPPNVAQRIDEFTSFVQQSDALAAHGVAVTPSLLIYGPPGSGKTLAAHHIAARLSLPILTTQSDGLISSYLGSTAKNIRNLFEHASRRPCVLFLDEFDAVAKLRDDQQELGELKRVVVSLLQNLDRLGNQTVVIAATNHEHLLDPAVWRRFAYRIRLPLPSESTRVQMFTHYLNGFARYKQVRRFAKASHSLSGADIAQISEEAKRHAVLAKAQHVRDADVLKGIASYRIPDAFDDTIDIASRVQALRSLSHECYTYRILSQIAEVSTGTVANILKGEIQDGSTKSPNSSDRDIGSGLHSSGEFRRA